MENMKNKKTNPNIAVFNKYAKEYDEWYEDNKTIYELELEAIKKFIPKSDKEKPEKVREDVIEFAKEYSEIHYSFDNGDGFKYLRFY